MNNQLTYCARFDQFIMPFNKCDRHQKLTGTLPSFGISLTFYSLLSIFEVFFFVNIHLLIYVQKIIMTFAKVIRNTFCFSFVVKLLDEVIQRCPSCTVIQQRCVMGYENNKKKLWNTNTTKENQKNEQIMK